MPSAVPAARRFRAAPLLLAGLALLAAAEAAGGFAAMPLAAGVLRGLHGVGAGLLVPATLLAAWERQSGARGSPEVPRSSHMISCRSPTQR